MSVLGDDIGAAENYSMHYSSYKPPARVTEEFDYSDTKEKAEKDVASDTSAGSEKINTASQTDELDVEHASASTSVVRDTFDDTSDYRLKEKDFPIFNYVMGLPPVGALASGSSNTDLAEFDELDQLQNSFPILEIIPNLVTVVKQDNKVRTKKVTSARYRFACSTDNAISYSHSNQYSPSGIGQDMQKMMTLNTAHELRQLSYVSKNALGELMTAGLQDIQGAMSEIFQTFEGYQRSKQNKSSLLRSMGSLGGDLIRGLLLGARIDFPNIWQNSQTAMTWTFNIELRTFATDPTSKEYQRDIINPMNALLTLSLPVGGFNLSYLEPPYISAKMGSVMDIQLGAISNIQWSAPLTDFNFKQVPRHIQVTLTVNDLYNVMMQGNNKGGKENEILTKERFLRNLGSVPSKKSVPNTAIWGNEFGLSGGNYKQTAKANTVQATVANAMSTSTTIAKIEDMYFTNMFKRYHVDSLAMGFNPDINSIDIELPDYSNFKAASIPNVTDMFGNMPMTTLYSGYKVENINPEYFDIAMTSFTPTSVRDLRSLTGDTEAAMETFFTRSNTKALTGDVLDNIPSSFTHAVSEFNGNTMNDVFAEFSDPVSDTSTPLKIVDEVVRSISYQIPNMIENGEFDVDRLVRDVVNTIKNTDSVLDNKIRLDNNVQNVLYRACDNMSNSVTKGTFISDIARENDRVNERFEHDEGVVSDQFRNAMLRVCDVSSAITTASTTKSILMSASGRNSSNKRCIVYASNNTEEA